MVGAYPQRVDRGYGYVDALAVMGSDLYVGGSFTRPADGTVTT